MQEVQNAHLTSDATRSRMIILVYVVTCCLAVIWSNLLAFAQTNSELSTTRDTSVFAGPGKTFGTISVLQPNVQVTIIPPSSVIIGNGVTIGDGVLIEGKPWINVRLPDGRSGYVSGSALCSRAENTSVRVAPCSP